MQPSTEWSRTGALLALGIVVGPVYLAVGLAQALARDGFDLGRHALSILANGPGGWVQTANFAVCGLLVVGAAAGIQRALRPSPRAAGWMLGCFGVSMIVAAAFPADPMDGFPPGTPEGLPTSISTTGMIHFAVGATGFLALAVSCFAVAAALWQRGRRPLAAVSLLAGASVLAGFLAPAVAPQTGPVAGIWLSVVVGWAWLALTSARLRRDPGPAGPARNPG